MSNEDRILLLLTELTSKVDNMQDDINQLKDDVKLLKHDTKLLKDDTKQLKEGQSRMEAVVSDLDPRNANRHVIIESSIAELHKDVKFIKHKLHVNEEEIFDIKDHLKLVK